MRKILIMNRPLKFDIAKNIDRACKARGMNTVSLAEKAGLHQTTISRLFKERDDLTDARISTIEAAAKVLKVPAWKFVYINLPDDLLEGRKLDELIHLLTACSQSDRERIIQTATDLARLAQS